MNLKELQEAHAAKTAEVISLRDKTKSEGRDMTDDEYDQASKAYAEAADIRTQIQTAQERKSFADKFAAMQGPVPEELETSLEQREKSLGEQFVESTNFKSTQGRRRFSSGEVELKATLTEASGAGAFISTPTVLPGITELKFQRLTVGDLLAHGTTAGPNIRYVQESTYTNAAAIVAEGAAKPASTLAYTTVDESVKKIAHTIKVTDETLEDIPQLRSYIDNRMVLGVQIQEEAQLLNGSGAGGNMTGLNNRAGVLTQAKGADSDVDAIFKAITKIRTTSTFSEPDAIVINPADWQILRLGKDSNGQYYAGGPFTGAYGNGGYTNVDALWGMRVVVTNAQTAGTALVGAFATEAMLFRRGGLTVEATNSNEDDFLKNLVALRAEERIALAVFRPAAFCTVTGIV